MRGRTAALVLRSLRVDARDVRSSLFRGALAALLILWLMNAQIDPFSFGSPGLRFFKMVTLSNFWFITAAGASFFATAITEEKEEQTLGLLKMAGIGSLSLLLGKWLPRLIGACLLLSVQFPFTLLAITLGGVTWHQVTAVFVALLAHLILVGNIGLLASVVCRRSTGACGLTVLALLALLIGPWVAVQSAGGMRTEELISPARERAVIKVADYFREANASIRIGDIMVTGFADSPAGYQVQTNAAAAGVLFLFAWLLFEPATSNDSAPGPQTSWLARRLLQRRRWSRRAWMMPIVWKEFQYTTGGWTAVVSKVVLYPAIALLVLVLFSVKTVWELEGDEFGVALFWVCLILLLLESASLAARIYRYEILQQTWSSLAILPRSIAENTYAKLGGAALAVLPAVGWLLLGMLLCAEDVSNFLDDLDRDPTGVFVLCYLFTLYLQFIHLAGLFSIVLRWGSWPPAMFLSGFLLFVVHTTAWGCFSYAFRFSANVENAWLGLLSLFGLAVSAAAHGIILWRLYAAAGE